MAEPGRSASRRGGVGRGRRRARERVLQALYQLQIGGQTAKDICNQFLAGDEMGGADEDYFRELLLGAAGEMAESDACLARHADRDIAQLDPVERAILWLGLYELRHRLDVPYRVVLSEAVELAKRYGAEDGYKYVNALLDKAALELRGSERAGGS